MSSNNPRGSQKVGVAVVGTGYWGINHVRAFAAEPLAQLVAVVEPDEKARTRALGLAPSARGFATLDEALADPAVEAVVLATPAVLHAEQSRTALAAGRHVFVEKPMALTLADAESVRDAARQAERVLAVGHLMVHHPAVAKIRELLRGGSLGDVYYLYASRVNLGRLRKDENALWSFGPHDVSIILDLLAQRPSAVAARGHAYLRPGIADVVFVHLDFPDGKMAHIQLSWLDPRKERRLTLVGSRRMLEFDDVHPNDKLRIYDKGYDRPPEFTQFGEYLTVRQGDVHIPRIGDGEPLALECRQFVRACLGLEPPTAGADEGVEVVRVLAAAQRSLETGGAPVTL